MKQRPQSAGNSSVSSVKTQASEKSKDMAGLNSEEIKILRRIKEEESRVKGLVRIFPTADSWDLYSSFLQYSSTHNLMVHQRLYPERHKGPKPTSASVTSSASRSKRYAPPTVKINAYLQITGGHMKSDFEYAEAYAQAVLRSQQYERKLGTRSRKGKRKNKSRRSKKKLTLVQGVSEDAEEDERGSEIEAEDYKCQPASRNVAQNDYKAIVDVQDAPKSNTKQHLADQEKAKPVAETRNLSSKEETVISKPPPHESPPPPPAPPVVKYNVVEQLQKGGTLNKVQARSAFAMYLLRVQQRLMLDSGGLSQDEIDALNEQMDLVLRFLKRAAVNLQQTFKVFVPSKKLPLSDRRRILAKQLGDFVHVYNKETDQLKSRKAFEKGHYVRRSDSNDGLDEVKFEQFINTASESELEEVLTTYTKLNKSASIFLGGKTAGESSTVPNRSDSVLSKRRDSVDTVESGVTRGNDDIYKVKSSSQSDLTRVGSSTLASSSSTGARNTQLHQQRPSSAHHSTASTSSYANAVSVYSQKLQRPKSASNSSQKQGSANRGIYSRPVSAFVPRPATSGAPRATHEPTVDTFNDKAIHDALQKLAVRQQARQYSAFNGTSLVGESRPATASGSREYNAPSSISYITNPSGTHITAQNKIMNSVAPKQSKTKVTIEDHSLNPRPPSGAGIRKTMYIKAAQAVGQRNPRSWHGSDSNLTADATFDSLVDGPDHDLVLAYNQVTGTRPQNYNRSTQGSKQYQMLQQQQQMMEQSKELLEQSKAKHQAMIAQAHAVKKASSNTEDSEVSRNFAPKPPMQPASQRKMYHSHHRIAKTASTDDVPLNFNFYNSLKYDKHTGKTKVMGGN